MAKAKYPFIGYKDRAFWYYCDYEDRMLPRKAGFHWNKIHKCWMTRFSEVAARVLPAVKSIDKDFNFEAIKAYETNTFHLSHAVGPEYLHPVPCPDGEEYMPHQLAAVEFMTSRKRVFLGDDMGIGKTIEAIALVNQMAHQGMPINRILIICPARLKIQWLQEWKKWFVQDRPVRQISGRNGFPSFGAGVIVINYDILKAHEKAIYNWGDLDLLIIDEGHYIKNPSAQRTQAVLGLQADRVLVLTGTPMPNRPIEMFTILNYLDPVGWPNRQAFAMRYCAAFQGEYGWDDTGHSNLDELQRFLRSTIMIRRRKKHVLINLPPKVRQIIEVPADCSPEMLKMARKNRAILDRLFMKLRIEPGDDGHLDEAQFKQVVSQLEGGDANLFEEMSTLRRETALSKVPMVIEHLHAALQDSDKVVCFAWHRDVVRQLQREFSDCSVMIYGGTTEQQAQEAEERFANDSGVRLFIGNIKSAGVGLNALTICNHVIFAEITWVPSDINQAEDRCHRKGTTGDSVLIQHLVLEDSVDALLIQTIVAKQKVIDEALDDDGMASLEYLLTI